MNFTPEIFTRIVDLYLPEPHSSLLNGIIFGIPLKGVKDFYLHVQIVGLLHLVVLSGTNITIMTAIIARITSGISKFNSYLITILIIVFFVLFVRPQAPIVRAAFTTIFTLVSSMTGRRSLSLYLLFTSAICIGLIWPSWISTLSFQLSYSATLGLILFSRQSAQPEKENQHILGKISTYFLDELKTSLAAQVFTVPLIFFYFRQVSFMAPFSNILISWIVPPLMIFGFLAAFLGKIHYALGLIPSYVCYGMLTYMIWVIEILAKVPYALIQF